MQNKIRPKYMFLYVCMYNKLCERIRQTIKHAILLLRKAFYMIRLPSRSLDEAEELQGCNRLSKPSSVNPPR